MSNIDSQLEPALKDIKAQTKSGLFVSTGYMHKLWTSMLDLIFPPQCAGCGRIDTNWCDYCQQELDQIPIARHITTVSSLLASSATGLHDGKLQQAIWAFKFVNQQSLAVPLGERLFACLSMQNWTFDIIVPVPLHADRLAERGYNQSQLLGSFLEKKLSLPCISEAIHRRRHTRSQVGLNQKERQFNMNDAFRAEEQLVAYRTILLIDDVTTTGSTLSACAQAAIQAGANGVYALTVSAATGPDSRS